MMTSEVPDWFLISLAVQTYLFIGILVVQFSDRYSENKIGRGPKVLIVLLWALMLPPAIVVGVYKTLRGRDDRDKD